MMKKIYYFFVNSGKVLFIFSFLFLVAISVNSYTIKGKVNYGNRCYVSMDENIVKKFLYEGVDLVDYYLECNTLYLSYDSKLSENKEIIFLASLSKFLSDNNLECDVQVRVNNKEHLLLATIINYQISYTKTIY